MKKITLLIDLSLSTQGMQSPDLFMTHEDEIDYGKAIDDFSDTAHQCCKTTFCNARQSMGLAKVKTRADIQIMFPQLFQKKKKRINKNRFCLLN